MGGEGKNRTSLLSGFICHGALSKALRRPSAVEELVTPLVRPINNRIFTCRHVLSYLFIVRNSVFI